MGGNAISLRLKSLDTRPQSVKVSGVAKRKLANSGWLQAAGPRMALDLGDDDVWVHASLFANWLTCVNWQMANSILRPSAIRCGHA
jgi:hypothetical protein